MQTILQWGNAASALNLLGIILTYPERVLIALVVIALVTAFNAKDSMIKQTPLVYTASFGCFAMFDRLSEYAPLLLTGVLLLLAVAVWSVYTIIMSDSTPHTPTNRYVKPTWLAYLVAVTAAFTAEAIGLLEVLWFRDYAKIQLGWIGYVQASMFAVRETLWVVTWLVMLAMSVLYLLQLSRRHNLGTTRASDA